MLKTGRRHGQNMKDELHYCASDLCYTWEGIKSMASVNQKRDYTRKYVKLNGVRDQDLF